MSVEGIKAEYINATNIGEFKKLFVVVTDSKNNLTLEGPAGLIAIMPSTRHYICLPNCKGLGFKLITALSADWTMQINEP